MPTMERTAQSVVLAPAEAKISAAMGTVPSDQSKLTFVVAKEHKTLPEQRHRDNRPRPSEFSDLGSLYPTFR
ncbi:Uncharacterised protein [Mycobacterium tuberculosis]|nr:Uncharacterised protein [Mycobacterium tuberculosis]